MNDIFILLFMLGISYLIIIHISYFIFGEYFKQYYNKEFNYWSIYYLGFNFKKEVEVEK